MSSDTVQVTFQVECRTRVGDEVLLTGNLPSELGQWDLAKAVKLRTSPATYPTWSTVVRLPVHVSLEFKFVIRRADGSYEWEGTSMNRVDLLRQVAQPQSVSTQFGSSTATLPDLPTDLPALKLGPHSMYISRRLDHVATIVKTSGSLRILDVSDTPLRTAQVSQLADAVSTSPCLQTLRMARCGLTTTAVDMLAGCLAGGGARQLRTLDLTGNAVLQRCGSEARKEEEEEEEEEGEERETGHGLSARSCVPPTSLAKLAAGVAQRLRAGLPAVDVVLGNGGVATATFESMFRALFAASPAVERVPPASAEGEIHGDAAVGARAPLGQTTTAVGETQAAAQTPTQAAAQTPTQTPTQTQTQAQAQAQTQTQAQAQAQTQTQAQSSRSLPDCQTAPSRSAQERPLTRVTSRSTRSALVASTAANRTDPAASVAKRGTAAKATTAAVKARDSLQTRTQTEASRVEKGAIKAPSRGGRATTPKRGAPAVSRSKASTAPRNANTRGRATTPQKAATPKKAAGSRAKERTAAPAAKPEATARSAKATNSATAQATVRPVAQRALPSTTATLAKAASQASAKGNTGATARRRRRRSSKSRSRSRGRADPNPNPNAAAAQPRTATVAATSSRVTASATSTSTATTSAAPRSSRRGSGTKSGGGLFSRFRRASFKR